MKRLWAIGEAAQADYERLRAAVLSGSMPIGVAARRFDAEGMWGLIRRPAAEPVFTARMVSVARPAWTPYGDPRLDSLADAYSVVLDAPRPGGQRAGLCLTGKREVLDA